MVVVFTDGNVDDIQALYLLLSRKDIPIDGIVIDEGLCSFEKALNNVLQILHITNYLIAGQLYIPLYEGSRRECMLPPECRKDCEDLYLADIQGEVSLLPHTDLMTSYRGEAISLGPLTTVAMWIRNGSLTHLTAFAGNKRPISVFKQPIQDTMIDMEINAWIDTDAYVYVMNSSIPKTIWTLDDITDNLVSIARAISLTNSVLSKTIPEGRLNTWKFWDMIMMMGYLHYI